MLNLSPEENAASRHSLFRKDPARLRGTSPSRRATFARAVPLQLHIHVREAEEGYRILLPLLLLLSVSDVAVVRHMAEILRRRIELSPGLGPGRFNS